jgi:hypothetical protein
VAEQMLGISIPQPTKVPMGWTVIDQDVRQWPNDYSQLKGAIPADFNQVWALPGTDLKATPEPAFIQFNVQSAADYTPQGLSGFTSIGPPVTLPNGLVVYGDLSAGYADWVAGGNVYRLRTGATMSAQSVEDFIDSLR